MLQGKHTSDPGPVGALFSTTATDNAEVVPPEAQHGPEYLWSTEANTEAHTDHWDGSSGEEPADGELLDDGEEIPRAESGGTNGNRSRPHDEPSARPPVGGVFSPDPVVRDENVVDVDDLDTSEANGPPDEVRAEPDYQRLRTATGAPLFSSRRGERTTTDHWSAAGSPRPTSATAGADADQRHAPFSPTDRSTRVPGGPADDPAANGQETGWRPLGSFGIEAEEDLDPATDPNGLRAAVSRLDPIEVEHAGVPIAVCGALLRAEEQVQGAVTGRMLGRPAVVVVTDSRVLVVNDRRWQPIVDEFDIDSNLVVRGRHDRNVAALSFADPTRLSMVDEITNVPLAIELAEKIREVGTP